MEDEEMDRKIARFRASQQRRAEHAEWKWENTINGIRPDQYIEDRIPQPTVIRGYANRRRRR